MYIGFLLKEVSYVTNFNNYLRETGLIKFINNHNYVKRKDTNLPCYKMRVINIKHAGKKRVYDLSIEEPFSNFIAEGIVSHNCNKLPKLNKSIKTQTSTEETRLLILNAEKEYYNLSYGFIENHE